MPRPRRRVVDRQHQVGLGDRAQPLLDDRPRLEPVGEAHHREVAADRRARARGHGLHGADARAARGSATSAYAGSSAASKTADAIPKTPASPPETTATRSPAQRQVEREPGAVELDGVAGRVPGQAGALRHPVDVRRVADDVVDLGQRRGHLGGEPLVRTRARARRPAARRPCRSWSRTAVLVRSLRLATNRALAGAVQRVAGDHDQREVRHRRRGRRRPPAASARSGIDARSTYIACVEPAGLPRARDVRRGRCGRAS